jgi:hypothetical protein
LRKKAEEENQSGSIYGKRQQSTELIYRYLVAFSSSCSFGNRKLGKGRRFSCFAGAGNARGQNEPGSSTGRAVEKTEKEKFKMI